MSTEDSFRADSCWSTVEAHLRKALWNLERGTPTNVELKSLAEAGRLRISPSTVAKEAGVSRTLIGMDDCAYPGVRKAIGQNKKSKVDELKRKISQLEEEKRELERQLRARDSTNAEIILRARAIQRGGKPKVEGPDAKKESFKTRKAALTLVVTRGHQ